MGTQNDPYILRYIAMEPNVTSPIWGNIKKYTYVLHPLSYLPTSNYFNIR